MTPVESLKVIHRSWLSKVSHSLARGEEIREDVERLLNDFYHSLQQALETGDACCLDSMLDEWVKSLTQTDMENQDAKIPVIIDQMLLSTFEIANKDLPQADALSLIGAIIPIYLHASRYASRKEMALNFDQISRELEELNVSLQRLDKSKSDFISIAAHELKTPLTLIGGYTAMLQEKLISLDSDGMWPSGENGFFPQSMILLRGIGNGTRRLREIIDNMIDVSLIDNNLLSLNFQPVWICRLLEKLENEFSQAIQDRCLTLEVRKFPGSHVMTFGDNERLLQAFRNLFSNAIKYTPDGGQIIIDGRKLPGFIEITFCDTGIGIDSENHSRIFEKFSRLGAPSLHSSGKVKFKGGGPGLGLPITKGIIEAHGGAIWVESRGYNETNCPGSIFHVLLPLSKLPPDDKAAKLFSPLLAESKDITS